MEQRVEHRIDKMPSELPLEAPAMPLTKTPRAEPAKVSQRASVRNTRASNRTSQILQNQPTIESAQYLTDPIKDPESISPSTKSLSQTSTASRNMHSPSTTASSIRNGEDDVLIIFDVPSPIKRSPVQIRQGSIERSSIRGISVSSGEDLTRSSGRTRKPTTKAKALASEGTMFYKSLRQMSDNTEDVDAPRTDESATAPIPELEVPSAVQSVVIEPEESIVASVESTPTRVSPRQRKATSKAATSETDRVTRKRKTPPTNVNRANKSARISSAVPEKPSKLRHPILSTEEEQETPTANSTPKYSAKARYTVANEAVACERRKACSLKTCMEEQLRLLAFADFAADDISDEEEDDDGLEALLAAAQDSNGPSSISEKIYEAHCVCQPPTSKKQPGDQHQDNAALNETDSELPGNENHEEHDTIFLTYEFGPRGVDRVLNPGPGEVESENLAEDGTQPAGADMSLQEAHAYFDNISDQQKQFFTNKEQREGEDDFEELKASYKDYDAKVTSDEIRDGITPKMKAARAIIVAQETREREKRIEMNRLILLRYEDHGDKYSETDADRERVFGGHRRALETDRSEFLKYQAMMEEKYSAPIAPETRSAPKTTSQVATTPKPQTVKKIKKRTSIPKKPHAEKTGPRATQTNGTTKNDSPGTSSLPATSTNGLDKNKLTAIITGAESASKTTVVENRESRRQSAPTQRMKILAANSTPTSSRVNKRESTGVRRTRGHRSTSPQTSTNSAQNQVPNTTEQEARPSKKIILKFRRPDLLV